MFYKEIISIKKGGHYETTKRRAGRPKVCGLQVLGLFSKQSGLL